MKSHITAIVVASAVVVGLAVAVFTAHPLESAQARLDRQINEQVETAQRMLMDYRPITAQLSMQLGSAATQPVDVPPAEWQDNVSRIRQDGDGIAGMSSLGGSVEQINSRFNRITGDGGTGPGVPASGAEAYRSLQSDLKYNDQLLADALRVVQQAIAMSDGEFNGSDHPGATRLEAVLCYHRADQYRREAAFHQAEADNALARLAEDVTWWHRLAADTASTQLDLGMPASRPSSAPGEVAGAPASEPVVAESKSDLLPIDDRIAHLRARKVEVTAAIEKAQAEAGRLTQAISEIKQRIAAASQTAADAEQQMLKLQQDGVDHSDPAALQRFTEAYERAAAANRAAWREKTTLEQGALRDARVDSTDEQDVLDKPLAPAGTGGQMTVERGLVALESDLRAVQAVIEGELAGENGPQKEGLTVVVHEIDRQIADLVERKKEANDRLAALTAARERATDQLRQHARAALAATLETLRLQKEGLEMAQSRGIQAAQRAKRAIEKRISDANALSAERSPDSPNQRLELIRKDKEGPGYALALIGDLHLLAAQINADQIRMLTAQARVLDELQRLGAAVDDKMLPEGVTLQSVPAEAVQVDAAKAGAEKARAAALEVAQQALTAYAEADTALQQLWVLHANIATVHHLMANLTTGRESVQHAKDARIEYLRAMKGREERPEIPRLQSAMASLTTRPAR